MRIQTIVCVCILSTCVSGFASAQTLQGANHRLELFGGIGWGASLQGRRPNIWRSAKHRRRVWG